MESWTRTQSKDKQLASVCVSAHCSRNHRPQLLACFHGIHVLLFILGFDSPVPDSVGFISWFMVPIICLPGIVP